MPELLGMDQDFLLLLRKKMQDFDWSEEEVLHKLTPSEEELRSKAKASVADDPVFKECKKCSEKLGSPVLCDGCLHNRELIYQLTQAVSPFASIINKADEKITLVWGTDRYTDVLKPVYFFKANALVYPNPNAGVQAVPDQGNGMPGFVTKLNPITDFIDTRDEDI